MRLRNRFLALCVAGSTVISVSSSIYALEVPKIEDTFTFNNISDTLDGDTTKQFIISSTNNVKVKGTNLYGVGDTLINSDKWMTIIEDSSGSYMRGVVKIDYGTSGGIDSLILLNNVGEAFSLTANSKYPQKIEMSTKVVDILSTHCYNSYGEVIRNYLVDENGDLYYTDDSGTKLTKVNIEDNVVSIAKTISGRNSWNTDFTRILALTDKGEVYSVVETSKGVLDVTKTPLKNVTNIYDSIKGLANKYPIKYTNGNIKLYDATTFKVSDIQIGGSMLDNRILNIVTDTDSSTSFISTPDGVYVFENGIAVKTNITQVPVAVSTDIVLCSDGKYYTISGQGVNTTLTLLNDYNDIINWVNENPIVSNIELANFKIDNDSVFRRKDSYDIEFSLVTKEQPKAFNVYYAFTSDINDISKRVLIEQNVPYSSLNPTEYDTGYTDSLGNKVVGKTYTYNWKIGNELLTDIQLIVEPIY